MRELKITVKPNSLEHLANNLLGRFNFDFVSRGEDTEIFVKVNTYGDYPQYVEFSISEDGDGLIISQCGVPLVGTGVDVDFILTQLNTFDSGFPKPVETDEDISKGAFSEAIRNAQPVQTDENITGPIDLTDRLPSMSMVDFTNRNAK